MALPALGHVVVVQTDGFECVHRHIFRAERVVDLQKQQAPAGACLTVPGAGAEEVGQRKLVGVGQAQQTGQVSERLVLAAADHQRFDEIEGMPLLCRRKVEQQRHQKVA